MKQSKKTNKTNLKNKNAITLIALVVTIVVLLILAGVSINLILDNNGIIQKAKDSKSKTVIADEKSKVEMAYVSAAINKLGDEVTDSELQEELDKTAGQGKTLVTSNGDGTLNVLFNETGHNYNVNKGAVEKAEIDNTKMAMFDTGANTMAKIHSLAQDGEIENSDNVGINLSIDGIKKSQTKPDISKMTDANIVSWTAVYTAYEQNPSAYKDIVPEGTKLCPIYMWFEESEKEKTRNSLGYSEEKAETSTAFQSKKVKTGIIYWWSESNNVYLNPDSSNTFAALPYLADITGLSGLKTDYVTNMNSMFEWSTQNLTNVNALRNWNTSNVKNMSNLFYSWFGKLTDISGLENWNTSNVENMSRMFIIHDLENIEPLRNWNTSKVTNMSYMFADNDDRSSVKKLDAISNWDVANVTTMEGMFYFCGIETLQPISQWNVSNVQNMSNMFCVCTNLTDASGINNWDITKVTEFTNMFKQCSTHPEFTKVTGTWDSEGTFTPTK